MVKGISVVIPNYNGAHLLAETLPTVLRALKAALLPSEIIVVDDCSTDGSILFLQQTYPTVRLVKNEQNSGFSRTCNHGVAHAKFDKILLLNSDVKLTPAYFKHQLPYFDQPDTFGVMGRIIGWHDDKIQDGAKLPSFHGAKLKTSANYLLEDEEAMDKGLPTMYLSGANAMVDKEKFLQLNGFNELFSPFYSEDVDLSLRAWRLGFTCYYDYRSICQHQVSSTIRSKAKKKQIQIIYDRNKLLLQALHLEGSARFLWYLQLIPETLGRILIFKGNYLQSLLAFFRMRQGIKDARQEFDKVSEKVGVRKSVKEITQFIIRKSSGKKIIF